jgi:hypothetical protein
MKNNKYFTLYSMKSNIKKLAIMACCLMCMTFSFTVFSEEIEVKKPYISFALVGDQSMMVTHNIDVSKIVDITWNDVSFFEELKKQISENGVIFSTNSDGEGFLQIRSVKVGEGLKRGKITIILSSGEKVTYLPPDNMPLADPILPSDKPRPKGAPQVSLSGKVYECVFVAPAWYNFWKTTQWQGLPNATVYATRGGVYQSYTTNSAGNYILSWASGTNCVNNFTVYAKKSNGVTVSRGATVACWGYSSTASLSSDLTFSNGISDCGMI